MTTQSFLSEQIRWYNNGRWGQLGFACPYFGENTQTLNTGILRLTTSLGRNLAGIMLQNPDVDLRTPPSIATLSRIHKLVIRARQIVSGRAVAPANPMMQAVHAQPAPQDFLIFPVPYFNVRNQWIQEWGGLVLMALSEAFQHTDNRNPFDFSTALGGVVGQYLNRVYKQMATELFGIDAATVTDAYVLPDAALKSYDPSKFFTPTEMIDTMPPTADLPTAVDLRVLTNGIPASTIVGLSIWPAGAGAATASDVGEVAPASTSVAAFPAAPNAL